MFAGNLQSPLLKKGLGLRMRHMLVYCHSSRGFRVKGLGCRV